jgi:hypothetical protein
MKLISLGVVGNQHYITEWVENTIQNGVKYTDACQIGTSTSIEDAIQNGVKETFLVEGRRIGIVKNTIQNGVKETKHNTFENGLAMEEVIQNGVKEIKVISDSSFISEIFKIKCKQTIRDGVKHTEYGDWLDGDERLDDIIENGVKETKMEEHHRLREVVQTVKNGIKDTTPGGYLGSVEMKGKKVHQFESPKQNNEVEDVIENGVKETSPHFLEILNPINFEPVIKEMKRMNEVNIVLEEGIKETKYCELHSAMSAEHIIRDGVKKTFLLG